MLAMGMGGVHGGGAVRLFARRAGECRGQVMREFGGIFAGVSGYVYDSTRDAPAI